MASACDEKTSEHRPAPEPRRERAPAPADPGDANFVVETRAEPYETFVDIHPAGRERPAWDLRLESKSLRLAWDRDRPRSDQTGELGAMLVRLHRRHPDAFAGASLLTDLSPFAYPEYAERLVRHAATDPAWKALQPDLQKVGSPRVGALHGYIVKATREQHLHIELDQAFAAIGMRAHLRGVEKCSDARSGDHDELGRWLRQRGIRSRMLLPTGCLMGWFDLEPRRSR